MDIDLLSKMVKELVMDNDRVSLPGLGTFVVETVPAAFSDKGYTVNPPYRKLSFRPIRQEDSLLVDLYASANGVSKDIAEKALTTFIDGLREVLQSRKNVVFPGLGRLRATKENNFFFVADEDLDIYPEGFGLYPLSLKTHVETKEEVSAAMDVLKVMIDDVEEDTSENLPEEENHEEVREEENHEEEVHEEAIQEVEPEVTGHDAEIDSEEEAEVTGHDAEMDSVEEAEEISAIEKKEPVGIVGKKTLPKVIWVAGIVVLSLCLLVVIYVVTARMFPDFIDSILYSAEEYNILHGS